MKRSLIPHILIMSLFFLPFLGAQSSQNSNMNLNSSNEAYEKEWSEIDSLEKQGLPRSALEKAEMLYARLDLKKEPAQGAKCLLYINKYQRQLSEDGLIVVMTNLETELEKAEFPLRSVLQSMLANVYSVYLENNYWRFSNRTGVGEESVDEKDPQTWPVEQFSERITELYLASTANEETQKVPIGDWTPILNDGNTDDLRPTLYDFLVHRALEYFMDKRYFLPEPVYAFYMDQADYFSEAADFAQLDITARDSSSFKFRALQLFQQALAFHLEDKTPEALVDLDLKRLRFVADHSVLADKEERYRNALEALQEKYKDHPVSAEVLYYLANAYYQSSQSYDALGDTTDRWDAQKAHELCQRALESFPESYGAGRCKQLISAIERTEFSLRLEEVNLPGRPILGYLEFRNLAQLHFRLIRIHNLDRFDIEEMNGQDLKTYLWKQKVERNWSQKLPETKDFQQHAVEIKIDPIELGLYALLISEDPNFPNDEKSEIGYLFTQISTLAYFTRQTEDNQTEFVLVDREKGQPIEGVLLEFYGRLYNREKRKYEYTYLNNIYSNSEGKARPLLPDNQYYQVKFYREGDVLFFPDGYSNYSRSFNEREEQSSRNVFFLDRAIYRPGQSVYFKGLVYSEKTNETPKILPNQEVTVTLYDANGEEAAKKTFQTNEFGTFNGVFQAPRNGLLGNMSLHSSLDNSRQYFRVEEYKRPKFEVVFDPLKGDYQLGDTVEVEGLAKAYAGNAIDGGKVQYRVTRQVRYPWRPWWYRSPYPQRNESMEIQSGELQTDESGRFVIRFPAMEDLNVDKNNKPLFYFAVYADVTDITGETHSAEKFINLGYVGLTAQVETPRQLDRQTAFVANIKTENLEAQFQAASGKIIVRRLDAPQKVFLDRYWNKPDLQSFTAEEFTAAFPDFAYDKEDEIAQWPKMEEVLNASFNTADRRQITLPVNEWPLGHYWLELTSTDSKGNPLTSTQYFWLYDSKAKTIPANVAFWFPKPEKAFAPGEQFPFILSSAQKEINVLYAQERKGEFVQEDWLSVEKWLETPYKITEADKGNIFFHYAFVKNNRSYQGNHQLSVPWSDKELKVEFSTFRDKLRPGQEEEWRIKISGPQKEAVAAEVVATMYDESLDAFTPNTWDFFPYSQQSYTRSGWRIPHFTDRSNSQLYYNYGPGFNIPGRIYRSLNWADFFYDRLARANMRAPVAFSAAEPAAEADEEAADTAAMEKGASLPSPGESTPEEKPTAVAPPIRKNLEETVFFLPELRTDKEGNVILRFTMKEALTRWKFLALAHTKELEIGGTTRSVLTQKELMAQPNPPRFLREGDAIEFTAKVSNLTEGVLQGEARLELFDPLSGAIITDQLLDSPLSVAFKAPAGQSARLAWNLKVPAKGISAVGHRVVASAGDFSDGEESVLPVLTNRILVTETKPMTVGGDSNEEFEFTAMQKASRSNTLEHKKFTLEFTSNPAWYAVKALPYLMEYPYECIEQIFSRYYANSLAASVANAHPQIKAVFEDWKNTPALESNLVQNEDLKAVLLQETPWVLAAREEAKQRKQIGLLFDLNRMAEEQSAALYKMVEQQSADGGFAWFPGGRDNWFMTQYIVEGMGRLQALGVQDIKTNSASREMIRKAVGFIDGELLAHYKNLAERVEKGQTKWEEDHLNNLAVHYLYARSFFPEMEKNEEVKQAYDYYVGQANQHWLAKGIYEQGLIAMALHRAKLKVTPQKIVSSLKERALHHDELGMYWKYDRGFFWNQMPIETHALLIEVFAEIDQDPAILDELRSWLLKNKQTSHWKTTKATAGAVYSLLQYGADWLLDEQAVSIRFTDLRKKEYKNKLTDAQQKAEAGAGYFRVDWDGQAVKADMAKVKIRNKNKHLAWGALYWQYLEDADKVKQFEDTPLTINKTVFKTVNTDRGPFLETIGENQPLEPGDKLTIRIELRVDRDMEYVHMKDMRASGFEPINVFSQYKWQAGLGYYESTRDAATNFFFDYLPRGTHVFEYPLRVVHKGDFSNGVTTVQCMYAPEFTSHSEGIRLEVE